MELTRFSVKACCGTTTAAFKLGKTISKEFLPILEAAGFKEIKQFTKSGILYVEHPSLVAQGMFGNNHLQITCKNDKCQQYIDILEGVLKSI